MNGMVQVLALEKGVTIAESIQNYIASQNVSYLVVGLKDEMTEASSAPMGRVTSSLLYSPRCTMIFCP